MASTKRTVAQIQADVDKYDAMVKEKYDEVEETRRSLNSLLDAKRTTLREIEGQRNQLRTELAEAQKVANPQPFNVGDIVEDEVGVRYRVTHVSQMVEWRDDLGRHAPLPGGVWNAEGIRLTTTGIEAHVKPRLIRSPNLTVVKL